MRRRRSDDPYEPVLQVAEIMLTFVTVNVAPLAALDALLDGDDEDGDEEDGAAEDGDDALGDAELSMRPVTITW